MRSDNGRADWIQILPAIKKWSGMACFCREFFFYFAVGLRAGLTIGFVTEYYRVAALCMLSTIVIGLAIDVYGPINDNEGGISVMAGMSHRICERDWCS